MAERQSLIPVERIERAILLIRGQKVMLDKDLAKLYGVQTRVLIQAVKRNVTRFPDDFLIQLTWEEAEALRSQIVTLNEPPAVEPKPSGRGRHLKYRPYAFTEQGVAMLSSVLRSERAVLVNVEIMRAFVRMRQLLAANADLARRLDALEKKYDVQFKVVFDAIRDLMAPPPAEPKRGKFGFASGRPD
jgi:hypothetical protein